MSDIAALKIQRQKRLFAQWAGAVSSERIDGATRVVHELIDGLIALGPDPEEHCARGAVDKCVRCLNDLDDGWICTIEREDLCEVIYNLVDLVGFEADEDWVGEREW